MKRGSSAVFLQTIFVQQQQLSVYSLPLQPPKTAATLEHSACLQRGHEQMVLCLFCDNTVELNLEKVKLHFVTPKRYIGTTGEFVDTLSGRALVILA